MPCAVRFTTLVETVVVTDCAVLMPVPAISIPALSPVVEAIVTVVEPDVGVPASVTCVSPEQPVMLTVLARLAGSDANIAFIWSAVSVV